MEKQEILDQVKVYYQENHIGKPYEKGDRISYGGRVYDEEELCNLVDASLDFWLTAGKYTTEFEQKCAAFLGVSHCALVNSGSSANLLAFSALTSPLLNERRLMPKDEVITVAAAFPTTVAPIIQNGCVPVFVDVTMEQYNIDCSLLEQARTSKTKAVFLAHTLGNPFDIQAVADFCRQHNLWLIEDNCDAFGTEYWYNNEQRRSGSVGDISTLSFYPAHHITMGEGGAVCTSSPLLNQIIRSMRDWGRDCTCTGGADNCCGHRFDGQYGTLPVGYDHKYVYSHLGYNLKATDLQAAIGVAQLKKAERFIESRRENWDYLYKELECLQNQLILPRPLENSNPSWFGFLITVKGDRKHYVDLLEKNQIQTRNLFAGNITRHPCFQSLTEGEEYRVASDLSNTDRIMNQSFWIGVYPKMNQQMLDEMIDCIKEAARVQ